MGQENGRTLGDVTAIILRSVVPSSYENWIIYGISPPWSPASVLESCAAGQRDFHGTNLRGQDLNNQELSEADFSGSDLRGTDSGTVLYATLYFIIFGMVY